MIKSKLLTGILLASLLAIPLAAGGCTPESVPTPSPTPSPTAPAPTPEPTSVPNATGTLKVLVTDAPPSDNVTSILVKLAEVQVHMATAEQEQAGTDNQTEQADTDNQTQGTGEWITIAVSDNASEFDLLKIKGVEQFLGENTIAAGKYTQVRLVVDSIKVGLNGDEPREAKLASGELKLVHPFDIVAGKTTALVIDFIADEMVNVTGADNIMVKPVVKLTVRQE